MNVWPKSVGDLSILLSSVFFFSEPGTPHSVFTGNGVIMLTVTMMLMRKKKKISVCSVYSIDI